MKMKLSLCGNDKKPEYVCNSCGNGNNSKKETIKKATTKNSKIQKEQFEEDYYEDDRKRKTSRYEKEKG